MKEMIRRSILLGVLLLACIQLAGCGKKDTGGKEGFVYVPEYVALPEGITMDSALLGGKSLYYLHYNWDEATNISTYAINVMDIHTLESKKLAYELTENEYPQYIMVDAEENLLLIISSYIWDEENPENSKQSYFLRKIDQEGNLLSDVDVSFLMNDGDYAWFQGAELDCNGNVCIVMGEGKVITIDTGGKVLFELENAADSWVNAVGTGKNGNVVLLVYSQEKEGLVLQEVDADAKAFGTSVKLSTNNGGNGKILPGIEGDYLLSSGNYVQEVNAETGVVTNLFSWIDCDIDSDYIRTFRPLEDGRILAVSVDYSSEKAKTELIYLTKMEASEVVDKKILTYGTMYIDYNVKKFIIEFNKTNPDYRIQVKEYSSEEADYNEAMKKLNADIVAGTGPDIIQFYGEGIEQYAKIGALEDLYKYIDEDKDINREDYLESVLKAYEINGKLCAITPTFSILTVMGKASQVGTEMGWTIEELIALADKQQEGTEIFSYGTRETILYMCCMYNLNQYIDWGKGQCYFNTSDFVNLLEFANRFPSNEEYNYEEAESTPAMLRNGKLLLMSSSISSIEDYQQYRAMFGEEITFIGYPSADRKGNKISYGGSLLGISSKSKNKDGAWEFVKIFMTEKYYSESQWYWGFPVLKSEFDKKIEESMTEETYEDENGEIVAISRGSYGWDDFTFEAQAATQEEVDKVIELIENVGTAMSYNEQINNIINEEAGAYFSGSKTAQEVADIIQSRVQIYVSENS